MYRERFSLSLSGIHFLTSSAITKAMTLKDVLHLRMMNQQIAHSAFREPAEVVNWMVAMQSQEFAMAKWAIGLRLNGVSKKEIEKDFDEGKILRTHLMRPTWHFVAPEDIRWMLALTAPRVNGWNAFMYRKCELDAKIFKRTVRMAYQIMHTSFPQTVDILQYVL